MKSFNMVPKVADLTQSRKRQFNLVTVESTNTDSYWDGGSKTDYRVRNIDTGANFIPPAGVYPWTVKNDYILQPGDLVIATGMFCGRPASPRLICRPEDEARMMAWLGLEVSPDAEVKAENIKQ